MKALQLTQRGLKLRQDYPVPNPGKEDALIRVAIAGICNTDLQLVDGYMQTQDLVLGHEFTGVVEECPACSGWTGKRVVGEINVGCGVCPDCKRRFFNHCPMRRCLGILNHDGAFAEYISLPVANLHEVPAGMEEQVAVFVEPVAAALRIQEQLSIGPSTRVAVIGDGKLGLLIALTLRDTRCQLNVFGHHERKLGLLAAYGIPVENVTNREREAADREHFAFDVVVECAGSPSAYTMAQSLVRPMGTLVLKSTKAEQKGHLDLNMLVVNEIKIIGSRCGPFGRALSWLEDSVRSGYFPVDGIVDQVMPLTAGEKALEVASQSGALKILLRT